MPKTLPKTSVFPSDVFNLDRTALEESYLEIRKNYSSLMRSRGAYKGQARKSQEAMKVLEQKLRAIAEREASVRAEAYEMLEIVTGVIGELEDAGDELVAEYKAYEKGRKTYQGGSFIGRLIRAVIKFINRWTSSKEKLDVLIKKQESMNKKLQEDHGTDS